MIEQKDVIHFFDLCAPSWDANMVRSDEKISTILDNAGVKSGSCVLDVACGTGVLMPDYIQRGVASVTGIDISPEMIKISRNKFSQDNVRFLCDDVLTADLGGTYDAIVIYNAFPHFPEPERLIARLASVLVPGGILTVAHGAGRKWIDVHHSGAASKVSIGLMPAEELAALFAKSGLAVTTLLSTDDIYQVAGRK